MDWAVRGAIFLLKFSMVFVPQHKYEAKISQIQSVEQKNAGYDLKGWEYRSITSPRDSLVHHYYFYPGAKPDAPTLLLIHGLNLDGRTFLNLSELSKQYQLIAYDLPEKTPRYKGSIEDFFDIVEEFCQLKELHSCYVAGVSFGGGVALHLAAEHPEHAAKGLVLISTGITGSTPEQKKQNLAMADWVAKLPDYKIYWFMETLYNRASKGFEKDTARAAESMLRVKQPDFYRQVALSMRTFDASAYAKKITSPVLVLFGNKDNLFSQKQVDAIKTFIPGAEIEIIPGGTHGMVYMKAPEIASRILSFANRNALPTSQNHPAEQ